jgi:hypothetical protein
MLPIPSAVGTFNKTKDLFEISNQLRYVELLGFRSQEELKVRKASTAGIVCLAPSLVGPLIV